MRADATCSVAAVLVGSAMFRPPMWMGREKSFLSRSLVAFLPVSAGRNFVADGSLHWSQEVPYIWNGMCRIIPHLAANPCVKAA